MADKDLLLRMTKTFSTIHIENAVKRIDGMYVVRLVYSLTHDGKRYESAWEGFETDEELMEALENVLNELKS